jgi:hypothetical protein
VDGGGLGVTVQLPSVLLLLLLLFDAFDPCERVSKTSDMPLLRLLVDRATLRETDGACDWLEDVELHSRLPFRLMRLILP